MTKGQRLVRIYTGTEITCLALIGELENEGVSAILKNDHQSSIRAGYGMGTPSSMDVYIAEADIPSVLSLVDDFIKRNPI